MTIENRARVVLVYSGDHERPFVQKVLALLYRQKYQPCFVGWDRLNRRPSKQELEGIDYCYIQRGWGFANATLLLGIPLWIIRLFFHTLALKADLLLVSDLDSALPVALAALLRGIPFVYDIRDNFALRHHWPLPVKWLLLRADAWVMQRARAIIVVDENRIVGPVERFREKVVILYNCPEDIMGSMPQPSLLEASKLFTVYAFGYLTSGRGIQLLLEAAKNMPEMRILMAGRFVEPWLERLALAGPTVDFRGWLPREQALKLCLDADIIFSFYDPVDEINRRAASNKWFDAMMTGKPILTNREVMRADWIEQEEIGYLCTYGDVGELVAILRQVRENPIEAARRGRKGRRLFETEYNWSRMEERLVNVFQESLLQRF